MTRRSFRRIALLVLVAIVPALVLGVFIGALAAADKGSASVPAAIVNHDRFVQTKGADGRTTTIAAGRLVVTNLTKPAASDATGASIDWRLSNASQAKDLLASGAVYAIVTIPQDFSKSISSVSSTDPQRARITIETDDAHGYIVSQLSSSLGTSLTATLGSTISRSVIEGLYGGFASLRTGIGSAATGADSLGMGATRLESGLGKLASGQDGVASGAASLGSGAAQLSTGADGLAGGAASLASGLDRAASGAGSVASGVKGYVGGVSSLASNLGAAASRSSGLQSYPRLAGAYASGVSGASSGLKQVLADPKLPAADRAAITRIQAGLSTLSAQNGALTGGAQGAAGLESGVARAATGARTLASNGASLASGAAALPSGLRASASGATRLASGASSLASGATGVASGADGLSTGAARIAAGIRSSQAGATKLGTGGTSLAAGLRKAVAGLPDTTAAQRTRIAQAVSDPVQASAVRRHETTSIGAIVATLIIPVGLWIGASAAVLLFGALRRRLLPTGIGTSRLVGSALGRGAVLAALQALLLVALMELTLHLDLGTAGLALLVSVIAGIAYFAVHQLLTALFDRAGAVISIVLLGVQLVAVGGLYPIQLVSTPFQVISPYLPLTAAVSALQSIITGAQGAPVGGGIATLVLTALIASVLTVAVVARRRTSVALFAPPAAPALG